MPGRTSYLVPAFVNKFWREFYRWARSYAGESPDERFPDECRICHGAGYVLLGKKRSLRPCPRWNAAQRACVFAGYA